MRPPLVYLAAVISITAASVSRYPLLLWEPTISQCAHVPCHSWTKWPMAHTHQRRVRGSYEPTRDDSGHGDTLHLSQSKSQRHESCGSGIRTGRCISHEPTQRRSNSHARIPLIAVPLCTALFPFQSNIFKNPHSHFHIGMTSRGGGLSHM